MNSSSNVIEVKIGRLMLLKNNATPSLHSFGRMYISRNFTWSIVVHVIWFRIIIIPLHVVVFTCTYQCNKRRMCQCFQGTHFVIIIWLICTIKVEIRRIMIVDSPKEFLLPSNLDPELKLSFSLISLRHFPYYECWSCTGIRYNCWSLIYTCIIFI